MSIITLLVICLLGAVGLAILSIYACMKYCQCQNPIWHCCPCYTRPRRAPRLRYRFRGSQNNGTQCPHGMFDRRDCRECTRIIQHQLAPIFPPPLLEIPHYRRPVAPEDIRWLEQHQRWEGGNLHDVLPQSTPLTRGVQESQPVHESSFRPSFALETGDQEDHVLFTPLSYREDYVEDYREYDGEDYGEYDGEDYREYDGEDYGENDGEDYSEDDGDVSLNDINVKIKYTRPPEF